jgi:hypothetical protein
MAEVDNKVDPPYRFDPFMTLTEVGWSAKKDIVSVALRYVINRDGGVTFLTSFQNNAAKAFDPANVSGYQQADPNAPPVDLTDPDVSDEMFKYLLVWSKPIVTSVSNSVRSTSAMFFINVRKIKTALTKSLPPGTEPPKEFTFTIITPESTERFKKTEPVIAYFIYHHLNFPNPMDAWEDWKARGFGFTVSIYPSIHPPIAAGGGPIEPPDQQWPGVHVYVGPNAQANAEYNKGLINRGTGSNPAEVSSIQITPGGEIQVDITAWEININAYHGQKTFPTKNNALLLNPPNAFLVPQIPLDDEAEYRGGVHEGGSNSAAHLRSYTLTVKVQFKDLKVTITGGPEGGINPPTG